MMNRFYHIFVIAAVLMLSGCGVFKKYSDTTTAPEDLFGAEVNSSEGASIAEISWRDIFKDPKLQELIDSALARNIDINNARLHLQAAESSLKAAKLNFIPGLSFSPSIQTLSSGDNYTLPLNLNWSSNGIGGLTNRKREADAYLKFTEQNGSSVQTEIIASVAKAYYQLQMLDRQVEIMNETEDIWTEVCKTQQALVDNGRAYSPSVNQLEASLIGVRIQKADALNSLKETENALCLILGQTPHEIVREPWGRFALPSEFHIGVPASVLENRPDIKAAGALVEMSYYTGKQALAAMLPNLSLTGLVGWQNGGVKLADPASLIYNAVASLVQPIFARGVLKDNLNQAQLQMEEYAKDYTQAILAAGNEVNSALRNCQVAEQKDGLYKEQVAVLGEAYDATKELMMNGKASYIETLMAQDNLLNAQLGEAENLYNGVVSLINLYIATGGGTK